MTTRIVTVKCPFCRSENISNVTQIIQHEANYCEKINFSWFLLDAFASVHTHIDTAAKQNIVDICQNTKKLLTQDT